MKAIADSQPLDPMPAVVDWLHYADAAKAVVDKKTWDNPIDKVNAMVEENVIAQLNNIKTHPCVAVGLRNNALRLHGWVYDIESGEIRTLIKTAKPTFPLQITRIISSNSPTGARMLWTSPLPISVSGQKTGSRLVLK